MTQARDQFVRALSVPEIILEISSSACGVLQRVVFCHWQSVGVGVTFWNDFIMHNTTPVNPAQRKSPIAGTFSLKEELGHLRSQNEHSGCQKTIDLLAAVFGAFINNHSVRTISQSDLIAGPWKAFSNTSPHSDVVNVANFPFCIGHNVFDPHEQVELVEILGANITLSVPN